MEFKEVRVEHGTTCCDPGKLEPQLQEGYFIKWHYKSKEIEMLPGMTALQSEDDDVVVCNVLIGANRIYSSLWKLLPSEIGLRAYVEFNGK